MLTTIKLPLFHPMKWDGVYPEAIEINGKVLTAARIGAYPYDCVAKDEHPDAMIYSRDGAWDTLHH